MDSLESIELSFVVDAGRSGRRNARLFVKFESGMADICLQHQEAHIHGAYNT